jgi:hypothetical protein
MPNERRVILPFLYALVGRVGRKRHTTETVVKDSWEFAIPDVSGDEAPVVCAVARMRDFQGRNKAGWSVDEPAVEEFRSFAGRVYAPIMVRKVAEKREVFHRDEYRHFQQPIGFDRFAAELSGPSTFFTRLPNLDEEVWSAGQLPSLPPMSRHTANAFEHRTRESALQWMASETGSPGCAAAVSDDRSDRLAEAAEVYANGLLVVDGVVWTTEDVREPYHVVETSAKEAGVVLRLSSSDAVFSNQVPFRLDRPEEAFGFARALVNSRKGWRLDVHPDCAEVRSPGLLRRDDAVMLAEAIVASVPDPSYDRLVGWPAAAAEAQRDLYRLRDAVLKGAPAAKSSDADWAGQVFKAAGEMVEATPSPLPYEMDSDVRAMVGHVSVAMRRWEDERISRPDIDDGASCGHDDSGLDSFTL